MFLSCDLKISSSNLAWVAGSNRSTDTLQRLKHIPCFYVRCQSAADAVMWCHKASIGDKLGSYRAERRQTTLSLMCVVAAAHHLFSEVGHVRVGSPDGAFGEWRDSKRPEDQRRQWEMTLHVAAAAAAAAVLQSTQGYL